jgi:broad specificity phosphatase PhoE
VAGSVRFPGGEGLEDVRRRAIPALERIVAAHAGDVVLVSGHGHLNRVLLIHLMGWPPERFWEIDQSNGCCWRVTLPDDPSEGERSAELIHREAALAGI